jgi:lipoprotein NlpI
MTFAEWAESKNFYRSDAAEPFEFFWNILINEKGFDPLDAGDCLDELVGTMRREYGE